MCLEGSSVVFHTCVCIHIDNGQNHLSFQQSVVENVYDNEVEIQPTDVTPLI